MMKYEGMTMRFQAKFVDPKNSDVDRRFIIQFYLSDDTLSVYEVVKRNSGIIGGKFLQRRLVKNVETGANFKPGDFVVGAAVNVNGYKFSLLAADEFTLSFMEGHCDVFRYSDVRWVEKQLQNLILKGNVNITAAFRRIDTDGSGCITVKELADMLAGHDINLTQQAQITLMRKYDSDHNGTLSYKEFASAILPDNFGENAGGANADERHFEGKHVNHEEMDFDMDAYQKLVLNAVASEEEADLFQEALNKFTSVLESLGQDAVRKEFLATDTDKSGAIDREEFRRALGGDNMQLSEKHIDLLEKKFFPGTLETIDYAMFAKIVVEQPKLQ
jgi:Ca2+-binding EF-hand superfamily protein